MLNLGNNNLKLIPKSLCSLGELTELRLEYNKIVRMPKSFTKVSLSLSLSLALIHYIFFSLVNATASIVVES